MAGAQGHITVRRKPKDGVNGANGLPGCILRQSEWAAGVEYRNDESLSSGTRYLDIAIVTSSANTFKAYKCKKTHTSSASIPVTNTTYWEAFNSLVPVYTPLIMAQNALLRFTQTNQLLVMKSDNSTVAAGMGGGDYPLWAGAVTPANAPFRVSIAGKLYATDAEISGTIKADNGYFGVFTIESDSWGDGLIYGECYYDETEHHNISISPDGISIYGGYNDQDIEAVRIMPYWYSDKYDLDGIITIHARENGCAIFVYEGYIDFYPTDTTSIVLKMTRGMAQIRHSTKKITNSTTLVANTTYVIESSFATYLYLPSSPKQGDRIRIINNSTSNGFTIRSSLTNLIFNVRTNSGSSSDGSYHYITYSTTYRVVEVVYDGEYWNAYYL